jgi:hypothetical protein
LDAVGWVQGWVQGQGSFGLVGFRVWLLAEVVELSNWTLLVGFRVGFRVRVLLVW